MIIIAYITKPKLKICVENLDNPERPIVIKSKCDKLINIDKIENKNRYPSILMGLIIIKFLAKPVNNISGVLSIIA